MAAAATLSNHLPLAISRKTFECLTSPTVRAMPGVRELNPYNYALNQTECGGCLYFHEPGRLSLVLIRPSEAVPKGAAVITFERDCLFSNFCATDSAMIHWTLNGSPMHFKCGEKAFKSASVVSQMDPADESSDKAKILSDVLEKIMSATSPKDCKSAVFEIPCEMFDNALWDKLSLKVMTEIQKWKFTIPELHTFVQGLALKAYELDIEHIYCVEGSDPRWGSGVALDEFHTRLVSNFATPGFRVLDFPGQNLMGTAVTNALYELVLGKDNKFLREPVEEYVVRYCASSCGGGTECPIFVYRPLSTPVQEESENLGAALGLTGPTSDDHVEEIHSVAIGRTGSAGPDCELEDGEISPDARTLSAKRRRALFEDYAAEGL